MSPWEKLLERPEPQGHLVQLYKGEELSHNVSRYLIDGYRHRDGLLVIADEPSRKSIKRQLELAGMDIDSAGKSGHIFIAGAQEMLSRFMREGQPQWKLFEAALGSAIGQVRPRIDSGLRAYSEMVSILWKAGQFAAAIRVEQFLNKLLGRVSFSLFCGYSIDVFGKDFDIAHLDALLCAHTHVLPGSEGSLEPALNLAMDEVLGSESNNLKLLITANFRPSWAVMPRGESTVLWLRNNLPEHADRIMARAREHYRTIEQTRIAA